MNKELVKKFGLTEAVNRFNQINEYTFISAPLLDEADDDDEQGMPQGQGQGMPQGQDMGQNQGPQGPQMPDQMQQQAPQQGMAQGQGEDIPEDMPQDPMQGEGQPMPQDDMGDIGNPEVEPMQPEDEVIDVDDLTNAQEETEMKLDGVDQKLGRLISVIDKFTTALDANDQKIAELADEFKKRNPTETEKLNIRSQAANPFTESPKDYWEKKAANDPQYEVMFNNGVPTSEEQREFEIRQNDIDNYNERDISDSFENLKLKDYFGI